MRCFDVTLMFNLFKYRGHRYDGLVIAIIMSTRMEAAVYV